MAIELDTRPVTVPAVGVVVRAATSGARRAIGGDRPFWSAMNTLLGVILTALGLLFAVGDAAVTASPQAYVIVDHFGPGGLRGHGFGWLVMGLVLMSLVCAERYALRIPGWVWNVAFVAITFDLFWTAFAFGLAGQGGGKTSWIGTVLWAGLAFWPFLALVLRPPASHREPRR